MPDRMPDRDAPGVQQRLAELIDDFGEADVRERQQMLLDFARRELPLPERLRADRDAAADRAEHRIDECMTPVFLWVEVNDGRVEIYADVSPEGPTARGFVALLIDAFTGATPAEVLAAPADLIQQLRLPEALGMNRMRGLHAIYHRVRRQVGELAR
ncbi:MAG TPA: SufE family protein [Pirellulales bacterium]|jgi:cysteine desulfuration protein SufE|nr:SufE family protein [Pirellulales bacterium]